MGISFDLRDSRQRRFHAFGPAAFPDPRDADLDRYVSGLRTGGPAAVSTAQAEASEAGRRVLGAYAQRAAERAVRDQSPGLLVLATIAVVVSVLDLNDHDALLQMPLVEDAAQRLGVEPQELFEQVSQTVGHPGTFHLVSWLMRPPEDRTLEAWRFEVVEDESGFRYRWCW